MEQGWGGLESCFPNPVREAGDKTPLFEWDADQPGRSVCGGGISATRESTNSPLPVQSREEQGREQGLLSNVGRKNGKCKMRASGEMVLHFFSVPNIFYGGFKNAEESGWMESRRLCQS